MAAPSNADITAWLVQIANGGALQTGLVSWDALATLLQGVAADAAAAVQARETLDQLTLASALLESDRLLLVRGNEGMLAPFTQVAAALAPQVLAWLNAQPYPGAPPALTVTTPGAVAAGAAVALSGLVSDPAGWGIEASADGVSWQTLGLTVSGTGWSASLAGLAQGWWNLFLRLRAAPERVVRSGWFPVGTPGMVIILPVDPLVPGGQVTPRGYVGTATAYITWSIPALMPNEASLYASTGIAALGSFTATTPLVLPARGGTYSAQAKNSADPSHPASFTLVVPEPSNPTLWVAPSAAADRWSAGVTLNGQWGFSKPPALQWRISASSFGGWTDAPGATIRDDGTWSLTVPAQSGLTAATYYAPQVRRTDTPGVVTPIWFSALST